MVQAVENLTRITGRVLARKSHPRLPDYDILIVTLERAEPIEGKADLLSGQVGKELEVSVRRELIGPAESGFRIECRAKRTPDGAMCEAGPRPDAFRLTPPGSDQKGR